MAQLRLPNRNAALAGGVVVLMLTVMLVFGMRTTEEDPQSQSAASSSTTRSGIATPSAQSSSPLTAESTAAPTTDAPDPPGPPVNGANLAAPAVVPWATPPTPPDVSGPVDPASSSPPLPVPAELDSASGRIAYLFTIAWAQAYLGRPSWQDEWTARWSPYATGELRGQAREAAAGMWRFATESATSAGLNVYSPVVVRVIAGAKNDAAVAEFDLTVARQTSYVVTNYTDESMSQLVTWRIVVVPKSTGYQVETVFDLTGGVGD